MDVMASRRQTGLSTEDLESLSAGLAAGKRVTVYLRDPMPSLDLDAGVSARVISIDGSTVIISPKGVEDQLPFDADELLKTRPTAGAATSTPRRSTTRPEPLAEPAPRETVRRETPAPVPAPAPAPAPAPKPTAAKAPRRPKAPSGAVTVTVTSASDTTWTVSVSHGSKKQGRPTEVPAERVAKAMRELGDPTAITAVDGVIESARAAAQQRIDDLSRELESARAVLAHLDGQAPSAD